MKSIIVYHNPSINKWHCEEILTNQLSHYLFNTKQSWININRIDIYNKDYIKSYEVLHYPANTGILEPTPRLTCILNLKLNN